MIPQSVLPFKLKTTAKKNRRAYYIKEWTCSVCGIHEGHESNGACQRILSEGGFWQQLRVTFRL